MAEKSSGAQTVSISGLVLAVAWEQAESKSEYEQKREELDLMLCTENTSEQEREGKKGSNLNWAEK